MDFACARPAHRTGVRAAWARSDAGADRAPRARRETRGMISLNRSPLARKIITFNLLAILILVAGVLFLNPFRDSMVIQRELGLVAEAELVAQVFEARIGAHPAPDLGADEILRGLDLTSVDAFVFAPQGRLIASTLGQRRADGAAMAERNGEVRNTLITNSLNALWDRAFALFRSAPSRPETQAQDQARALVSDAVEGRTTVRTGRDTSGSTIFSVATPIVVGSKALGVVALTSVAGEIDQLVRNEREQVLQMFVIAILVSIGLSLVLASTIANPLSDLAAAAESGRDRHSRKFAPGRVRIPDLTARPDEIGRLSGALRGMVAALYDRIDANEQFAADVAHEIKNPLASLRSAAGTLRLIKKEEQRATLLDVIEHDVRRLDRLVSDISNASRLDSELVTEEEDTFDLIRMIRALSDHLSHETAAQGIDFLTDLPGDPILIDGLESRLAQVFVNLISNAVSFCEDGDAIRIWVRKRDNRVLVVVEDTGPGIPEEALTKVFGRFYSERPATHFGDNSGLGLAISKQIVEAHGGVIWAENIRPTDADATSEPLGARFVVGLPV